jgi:hypothetical protein
VRLRIALPVILLVLLSASLQSSLLAQSSECTGREAQVQLRSIDPVYVDAMELARYLMDHRFIVKCVLGSKMQHSFDGQKGAALYRTDRGSFEVLFLPKAETFNAIEVVEVRQNSRYLYSFRGTPRFHSTHIDSSGPVYFIKFANVLFVVWDDSELAASIQAALSQ